ncbi:protein transport protein Sec24C-like isoform X2 [Brachyhypopomus gauderio]|uniref:protein transport protein Sec24C-like isoform X2 n=1 Tax=Brachyhypopomus gauderio TaxID=698409 RepID=UPI0040423FB9
MEPPLGGCSSSPPGYTATISTGPAPTHLSLLPHTAMGPSGVPVHTVKLVPPQQPASRDPQPASRDPQPRCDGVVSLVRDVRNSMEMPQQPIGSQQASQVSSPKSESRYGLNPQQLPSVVRVMNEDRAQWEEKVFISGPRVSVPPLSTTPCTMEDGGSATARFIRCTCYCFPAEAQSAQQSHVPLAAVVCPLARQESGERQVPLCEAGECVTGCRTCGAFMCPAMSWQDCGQRFYCPFCGELTEVPWQSYQPTNKGRRVDWEKRPELSLGSYEVLETQKGAAAVLVLALDVSVGAISSGQLDSICQQLCSLLVSLEGSDRSDLQVALMTYDSRIHVYDLSPSLSRPHMMILTDTDELELPVRKGILVPLQHCRQTVESILQQIPLFKAESQGSLGSQDLPVLAGLKILQSAGCPGKLLVFHSSPLVEATHKQSSLGFFTANKSIFQVPDASTSLAKACVNQGCSVQLFVFSQQDVGGAWPGHIPFLTGGKLICYNSLQRWRESGSVETSGLVLTLRWRTKPKLCVSGCYGSFLAGPDSRCVALAAVDWRATLAFEFTHNKCLDETRGVAIQVALSYSSPGGHRKTRVHTVTLGCSHNLLETFRTSQAETLLAFYCKKMYCRALETPLQCLREQLQMEVTEVLACYRKHCCTTSVSPGQLVLPHFLKVLPVYVNSLRKSEVLLPGLRSSVHLRMRLRALSVSMDTRSIALQFYPLILPLLGSAASGSVPPIDQGLRCTVSSLCSEGLYLFFSPLEMLLWVGSRVPVQTLNQLFNTSCFTSLTSGEVNPPCLVNPLSASLWNLIRVLQSWAVCSLTLKVVKEGDGYEESLQRLLVEDKSPNGGASYPDFLFHLHVNSLRRVVG